MPKYIYTVNFNSFKNFFFLKQQNTYILILLHENNFYCFGNSLDNNNINMIYFSKNTKNLSYNLTKPSNSYKQDIDLVNMFLKNLFLVFFKKIKFVGKGFRIQFFKKKGILNFTFGHSHMYMMFLQQLSIKKISKFKYFFKSTDLRLITKLSNELKRIKPMNKYTLRGLRLGRMILIKRKGRKSPNL